MTVPHETRPLAGASIAAAFTTLRARGMRVSAARRHVLEALYAAEGPVSAEAIAAGLGGRLPGADLASVYRNLGTLEQAGLASHMHFGHGAGLYELSSRRRHGYAACERCGAHRALPAAVVERLVAMVRAACGYEASLVHFPIAGRCPDCEEEHHAHP
jgi:Fe2+ or Zn2+ uptake regulation protein